jgi:outer membrane protein TolC
MFNDLTHAISRTLIISMLLLGSAIGAAAQNPPDNPAQKDATRPPGTEQNQTVPPQSRPNTTNPTTPPGTEAPSSQAPPGTTLAPPTTNPGSTVSPAQTPGTQQSPQTTPQTPSGTQNPAGGGSVDLTQSGYLSTQPRPVPPLPSLERLGVNSSAVMNMTLNDAVRRALENNPDIEVARDNVRFAETQLRSLEGVYEPLFALTPQIDYRVTPQASRFGGATSTGTTTTTNWSVNPSINKLFQTGGGTYNFFFNQNRQTTDSTANLFNPLYSGTLGVTFTQPLLRDRSIDRNRHDIRIQKKAIEQSDADFRRKTIDIIQQVQQAYWNLVFARRDEEVQITNLNLSRENFKQTEAQIAAGAAAPLTRAQVQTELSLRENSVIVGSQNISIAENALKQLILHDQQDPTWQAEIVTTDEPTFDSTPVNLVDAMAEARANRPELQRLRIQYDINNIDQQYFRNQTKPRIDIQSTVATTGLAGTPLSTPTTTSLISLDPTAINQDASSFLLNQIIATRNALPGTQFPAINVPTITVGNNPPPNLVGGYGRMFADLFNLNTRNITVGVSFQIPFHNKTAEANLAGAKIQRSQLDATVRSTELAVEVDVRNAAQGVETARRSVLTARSEREAAEVQLAGEQKLYQVGRSTTFLLFQREDQLASARDAEIKAETDYNKALSNLQHATSTTLRANHVIVETPTAP